jgi:hypothetical protein
LDYDANGWDGKRFMLIESISKQQTAEFTVINDDAFPQIYNTKTMCVTDDTCYTAYLDYSESTTPSDVSVVVEIPECNAFFNPWIRKQTLCWSGGVCNACNASSTEVELTLTAVASQQSGWGMNYYTIFTAMNNDDVLCEPDELVAAGTGEWNMLSTTKTHCLMDGDYIVRLMLNDPQYYPILTIDACNIEMHTSVPSLYVSEGSISATFSIRNGMCYTTSNDDDMTTDDDKSNDDNTALGAGSIAGLAVGLFCAGGAIVGGIVYYFIGRSMAASDPMTKTLLT